MIQEASRNAVTRSPLKLDGPELPGAQEWNLAALKGCEGIGRSSDGRPLVDHDGSGSGPGIEHGRIRGVAVAEGKNP